MFLTKYIFSSIVLSPKSHRIESKMILGSNNNLVILIILPTRYVAIEIAVRVSVMANRADRA